MRAYCVLFMDLLRINRKNELSLLCVQCSPSNGMTNDSNVFANAQWHTSCEQTNSWSACRAIWNVVVDTVINKMILISILISCQVRPWTSQSIDCHLIPFDTTTNQYYDCEQMICVNPYRRIIAKEKLWILIFWLNLATSSNWCAYDLSSVIVPTDTPLYKEIEHSRYDLTARETRFRNWTYASTSLSGCHFTKHKLFDCRSCRGSLAPMNLKFVFIVVPFIVVVYVAYMTLPLCMALSRLLFSIFASIVSDLFCRQ